MSRIGIIGAGAWGTSLASVLQRAGNDIVLQAHEAETVDSINVDHINGPFLPGVLLDPKIFSTTKLENLFAISSTSELVKSILRNIL